MDDAAPEVAVASVAALVDNANRLGLTWELKLASIVDMNEAALTAICDGDTVPIGVTSMIGTVATDQRVYVITIPPSGNYIVGFPKMLDRFANVSTAGALAAASGVPEVAIPSASWTVNSISYEPVFTFLPYRIYRITISGSILPATQPGSVIIRVRKGAATITGTQLIYFEKDYASGGGIELNHTGWVKNNTGSPVFTKLSLTIQRVTATTVNLYGDSARPMILLSESDGSTVDIPGITAAAIQV